MKRLLATALVLCTAGLLSAPVFATDINLNVYPFSARKMSNSDLWDDVDNQYALGGMVDFGRKDSHLHFVTGLHTGVGAKDFSNPLVNDVLATTSELSFGMSGVWRHDKGASAFVSGGLSFVHPELQFDVSGGTLKDDDQALGFFVEGGVYWRLSSHFNLGLYGRMLGGTSITLFGEDGDVDYWQVGPMIGWSWPAKH
jgi:hypothetical protein